MMVNLSTLLQADSSLAEAIDEAANELKHTTPRALFENLKDSAIEFMPKLLYALIALVVAHVVIKGVCGALKAMLKRSRIDATLHSFILGVLRYSLWILVGITVLFILNVPASPLLAVLGSVGLALSLALKDSLSNLAGGISVLFNRPFLKGDLIEVKGVVGCVKAIDLFYTRIVTDDDKIVYLPNGDVSKSVLINYSAEPLQRLDLVLFIPISADFEKVQQIIAGIVKSNAYTLHQPEPIVAINGKNADSYSVSCRVWTKAVHYDAISGPLHDEIDRKLREAGM